MRRNRKTNEVREEIRPEDALKGFSKYKDTPHMPEDHWAGSYYLEQMFEEAGDLATFIEKLKHILRNAKKKGFERVDLELDFSDDCYSGKDLNVELHGWRPETKEERLKRLREARQRRASAKISAAKQKLRKAEREREEYARLKKKFEGK